MRKPFTEKDWVRKTPVVGKPPKAPSGWTLVSLKGRWAIELREGKRLLQVVFANTLDKPWFLR